MELGWFEDFLALADSGNFNRAAARRHMTQPAFSRRIRALEAWAGAPLFDRSTHRIALTAAGEAMQPLAADIARRVAQCRATVQDAAEGAASALRFAATHALSLTFFPEWLRGLEREGAVAGIHLLSDTMRACEAALRQGQAQFLLCHSHPRVPEGLEPDRFRTHRVGADHLVPVAAPGADGRPLFAVEPAAPAPLLFYSPESALGWIVKAAWQAAGASPVHETAVTAHQASVLAALARAGRGLAWLPLSLVRADLSEGRLLRAGAAHWDIPLEIRLIRPRARQTPAAEAFWARLQPA